MLSLVLATGAFAKEYGKSTMTQPMQQPEAQVTQPRIGSGQLGEGEGVYYFGSLTSIDPATSQFVVKTEVPGLLGPQSADVAFSTSADTTMSVCFKSLNACDMYFTDKEGWNALNSLQGIPSLASANKQVIVIGNPETSEVVHVQILYGV
jgi:hypothetical protein